MVSESVKDSGNQPYLERTITSVKDSGNQPYLERTVTPVTDCAVLIKASPGKRILIRSVIMKNQE